MRPNDIDIALVVHVLGAMVLVGGLVTATAATIIGWNDEGASSIRRLSAMTLFAVALPGFLVMRGGAAWVQSKEHLDNLPKDPTWLGIGLAAADVGALVLVIALILGGIGVRRNRHGGGRGLLRASGVLAALLLVVYVVAVWAMGAKPT